MPILGDFFESFLGQILDHLYEHLWALMSLNFWEIFSENQMDCTQIYMSISIHQLHKLHEVFASIAIEKTSFKSKATLLLFIEIVIIEWRIFWFWWIYAIPIGRRISNWDKMDGIYSWSITTRQKFCSKSSSVLWL